MPPPPHARRRAMRDSGEPAALPPAVTREEWGQMETTPVGMTVFLTPDREVLLKSCLLAPDGTLFEHLKARFEVTGRYFMAHGLDGVRCEVKHRLLWLPAALVDKQTGAVRTCAETAGLPPAPWYVEGLYGESIHRAGYNTPFEGDRVQLRVRPAKGTQEHWVGASAVDVRWRAGTPCPLLRPVTWVSAAAVAEAAAGGGGGRRRRAGEVGDDLPAAYYGVQAIPSGRYAALMSQLVTRATGGGTKRGAAVFCPDKLFNSPAAKKARTQAAAGSCLVQARAVLKLTHKAGEGTYGEVHRAKCEATGVSMAVKRLRDEGDSEKDAEKRRGIATTSLRELSVLACVNGQNPHIVKLLRVVVGVNRHLYAEFEWVANDLSGVFTAAHEQSGLEERTRVNLLHQTLRGIRFLHSVGLVHRDLKPSNVLVGRDGTAKICDFGFINQENKHARTPTICTPTYRPPEVMFQTTLHAASLDMWGYGCIVWRAVCGHALFKGSVDADILRSMLAVLSTPVAQSPRACVQWADLYDPDVRDTFFPRADSFTLRKVEYEKRRLPSFVRSLRCSAEETVLLLDLLERLLAWDPKVRLTAEEALGHDYFKASRMIEDKDVVCQTAAGVKGLKVRPTEFFFSRLLASHTHTHTQLCNGSILELNNLHIYIIRNPQAKFEKKINSKAPSSTSTTKR